jgi:hypothetical protein
MGMSGERREGCLTGQSQNVAPREQRGGRSDDDRRWGFVVQPRVPLCSESHSAKERAAAAAAAARMKTRRRHWYKREGSAFAARELHQLLQRQRVRVNAFDAIQDENMRPRRGLNGGGNC